MTPSLREKCPGIRSFSGPYFPAFRLNTEKYSVSLLIKSEYRKMRTRKTQNTDTFHAVLRSHDRYHMFYFAKHKIKLKWAIS